MKKIKKMALIGLTCMTMLFGLAACGEKKDTGVTAGGADTDSVQAGGAEAGGQIVFGTNAEFPPFEFVGGQGVIGQYDGIDMAIAKQIGTDIGKEATINNMEFDSLLLALQNGQVDAVIAGMTVTDERKKNVDFTESYAKAVQVVIVKEDSDIKSIDDISSKNKIGVQQGTTGDIYASDTVENGGYGEDAVTKYNSGPDAVQALLSDKVDCVIIDNEPAKAYVAANQGLKILDSSFADEEYAICVKKGNSQLKDDINKALKELKDDGTIDKIVSKYIK